MTSTFDRALADCQTAPPRPPRWLLVPCDQLSADIGPLSRSRPMELGLIFVESSWSARRRPYHKQRLALLLTNMRHFALEQGRRGFAVRYLQSAQPCDAALRGLAHVGTIDVMEPAERELRTLLAPLVKDGKIRFLPHEGWLSKPADFHDSQPAEGPWRMDRFYRHMRKQTGYLMKRGKPEGGKYSFDQDNRKPWKGSPEAPEPLRFEPDDVTREVCELVTQAFSEPPGDLTPTALPATALPATAADATALWKWARRQCVPQFGPFEDAMSSRSSGLFHTRISALLNVHRLLPKAVIDGARGDVDQILRISVDIFCHPNTVGILSRALRGLAG